MALGVAVLASAVRAAGDKADFSERLESVEKAGLSEVFAGVAVKTDRPVPWRCFVRDRYRLLKGRGDVRGGDLGGDADAASWLAVLDPEYRAEGRLLYVEGGEIPGVPEDKWLTLKEFGDDVMPEVVQNPSSFDGGKVERAVTETVGRARALNRLSWRELPVLPGTDVAGWRPIGDESLLQRQVRDLDEAYARRDVDAMRSSAAALAAALKRQPGYPPAAKLSLEANLERFAVLKIGFGLYALAAVLFILWGVLGRPRVGDAGAGAAAAGFLLVTAALAGRWVIAGHVPVVGAYEIILLFSWAVVLCFIVYYLKNRGAFLGLVLMPVAVALGVLASFFPSGVEAQVAPALRSGWFTLRGVLAALGGAGFAVAFAAAALRLFKSGGASARFPSGEKLAVLEYRAMTFGYPVFAVGVLAAGAMWAQQAVGAWWAWARGDLALLVVLALATAYVHARGVRGRRGSGAAALAVLTFVAAVLSFFAGVLPGGGPSSGL